MTDAQELEQLRTEKAEMRNTINVVGQILCNLIEALAPYAYTDEEAAEIEAAQANVDKVVPLLHVVKDDDGCE